jgi:HD-GYP domain-containing protein (c-di-GMP phosphodiesterase class II)
MATVTGIETIEAIKNLYNHCFLTCQHSLRVGDELYQFSKYLKLDNLEDIYLIGIIHDIGKLDICPKILNKTTPLSNSEFEEIKRHTIYGEKWINRMVDVPFRYGKDILYHHENWNGQGYYGLQGEEIPLLSRMIRIVDTYDTMLYGRIYKKAIIQTEVISEIEALSGKVFDPALVKEYVNYLKSRYCLRNANGT